MSVVHALPSLQLSGGVFARQTPNRHASTPLQTLLSVQEVASATATLRQPSVTSHESVVQRLLSLQFWTWQ